MKPKRLDKERRAGPRERMVRYRDFRLKSLKQKRPARRVFNCLNTSGLKFPDYRKNPQLGTGVSLRESNSINSFIKFINFLYLPSVEDINGEEVIILHDDFTIGLIT